MRLRTEVKCLALRRGRAEALTRGARLRTDEGKGLRGARAEPTLPSRNPWGPCRARRRPPPAREAAAAAAGGGGRGSGRGHRPPARPPCAQSLAILSRDPGPVFTTCAQHCGWGVGGRHLGGGRAAAAPWSGPAGRDRVPLVPTEHSENENQAVCPPFLCPGGTCSQQQPPQPTPRPRVLHNPRPARLLRRRGPPAPSTPGAQVHSATTTETRVHSFQESVKVPELETWRPRLLCGRRLQARPRTPAPGRLPAPPSLFFFRKF